MYKPNLFIQKIFTIFTIFYSADSCIFLIISLLFRLDQFRGAWGGRNGISFADRIRNMSDENYTRFKQNFNAGCGWKQSSYQSQSEPKAL